MSPQSLPLHPAILPNLVLFLPPQCNQQLPYMASTWGNSQDWGSRWKVQRKKRPRVVTQQQLTAFQPSFLKFPPEVPQVLREMMDIPSLKFSPKQEAPSHPFSFLLFWVSETMLLQAPSMAITEGPVHCILFIVLNIACVLCGFDGWLPGSVGSNSLHPLASHQSDPWAGMPCHLRHLPDSLFSFHPLYNCHISPCTSGMTPWHCITRKYS